MYTGWTFSLMRKQLDGNELLQLSAPVRNASRQDQHLTESALRMMLRAGHGM